MYRLSRFSPWLRLVLKGGVLLGHLSKSLAARIYTYPGDGTVVDSGTGLIWMLQG